MADKKRVGSIHLRKDGRYEGRIVVGYNDKGLPITKNVTSKSFEICEEKLAKLALEVKGSLRTVTPEFSEETTVEEWLTFWFKSVEIHKLRANTKSMYEMLINRHIIPSLGSIKLINITAITLQEFYNNLKEHGRIEHQETFGEGLSHSTTYKCHRLMKMALDYAVEEGIIRKNPADDCEIKKPKSNDIVILDEDELERLLIQSVEDDIYELILMEICTGLRLGEILGLKWSDIDFDEGILSVSRQISRTDKGLIEAPLKTKSSMRTMVLPEIVIDMLNAYHESITSEYIFPSPLNREKPRDPRSVRRKVDNTINKANCKHVTFHELRHTFASNALEAGVDMKTLSKIMGHVSSVTTMRIYTHTTSKMKKDAATRIDTFISADNKAIITELPKPKEKFVAVKNKTRKKGTGCIHQINETLFEGRYSPRLPNGKRLVKTVYAGTYDECEALLKQLIIDIKKELNIS